MRGIIITFFILYANLCIAQEPMVRVGLLGKTEGPYPALIRRDRTAQITPAVAPTRLFAQDTLMTGPRGSATADMGHDTTVYLGETASLTFNSRWQVVQNSGAVSYRLDRYNPDAKLEIITPFGVFYSARGKFRIETGRKKRIHVDEGNIHIRNFGGLYNYYSSDITCNESFITTTNMINLKGGESVSFFPPYAIKTCGEVGETLVNDTRSIIVFYTPHEGEATCRADTPGVDRESDITRIGKAPWGCYLELENQHPPCRKLAQKNVLFSLLKKSGEGARIEIRPLNPKKESYVQFRCR